VRPQGRRTGVLRDLEAALRALPIPVIGRLAEGALWLDLRCLEDPETFRSQLGTLTRPCDEEQPGGSANEHQ